MKKNKISWVDQGWLIRIFEKKDLLKFVVSERCFLKTIWKDFSQIPNLDLVF